MSVPNNPDIIHIQGETSLYCCFVTHYTLEPLRLGYCTFITMVLSGLPHILSKLRLPDHLEGVISGLGGLGNIVPESISHHFQLCLWCVGIEEVGMTACWMDTGTVKTGLCILQP